MSQILIAFACYTAGLLLGIWVGSRWAAAQLDRYLTFVERRFLPSCPPDLRLVTDADLCPTCGWHYSRDQDHCDHCGEISG